MSPALNTFRKINRASSDIRLIQTKQMQTASDAGREPQQENQDALGIQLLQIFILL